MVPPLLRKPQGFIEVKPGASVIFAGKPHTIVRVLDLDTVLVSEAGSGPLTAARLSEIGPVSDTSDAGTDDQDLAVVSDEEWKDALERYALIRPYLEGGARPGVLRQVAKASGVHVATLYRWIGRFQQRGTVASLLGDKPGVPEGASRLPAEIEAVIRGAIEEHYLTSQRRTIRSTAAEVLRRCRNAGLRAPHLSTVRRRVTAVSGEIRVRTRLGRKAADDKYRPVEGTVPEPAFPLELVQIDHTELDLVLVDDVSREPVGRPWVTLAMDVYSRMVAGFYVALDPPGALSVGLCLTHAVLPKDAWLNSVGVRGSWPVWGLPGRIHADNAKEFRGGMLRKACENYGMGLCWRPVARPHYGGHIERLLGTFLREIHELPGTTFSNVAEKGAYDSEAKAVMTLRELEAWLTTFIVDVYHQRVHSSLGMSPRLKFEKGIFGSRGKPGRGLPKRIVDEERLRLDFLPFFERTVQRDGIALDGIHYFGDVLRNWVQAPDPAEPKQKRQFIVRRDPRDIAAVYFFDPELQEYFRIPYRDTSRPAIIEAASVKDTRATRRAAQRRRDHQRVAPLLTEAGAAPVDEVRNDSSGDIEPFEELEEPDE